jgi:hypothetical protein
MIPAPIVSFSWADTSALCFLLFFYIALSKNEHRR